MRGPEAREQLCFSVNPSFGRRGGWDGSPIPRINSADMVTSDQSPSADMMKAMLRCAMEDGTAVQVAAVSLGPRHRVCRYGSAGGATKTKPWQHPSFLHNGCTGDSQSEVSMQWLQSEG